MRDVTTATTITEVVEILIDRKSVLWRAEARETLDRIVAAAGGCVWCARGCKPEFVRGVWQHVDLDEAHVCWAMQRVMP